MVRRWRVLALVAAAVLLVLFILLPFAVAWSLLHPPRNQSATTPADLGFAYEELALRSPDGVPLSGWWIPGNRSDAAVLLLHGYKGSKASMLEYAPFLHRAGYPLLLLDLRNHGYSGGSVTTFGLREWRDASAAAEFLESRNFSRIGVLGISMGASTAVYAAASDPRLDAVVSDVGFFSLRESAGDAFRAIVGLPDVAFLPMVSLFGEWLGGAPLDHIAPGRRIGNISPRPVLVIHTDADRVVGSAAGHRLFGAAGEPKELWAVPDAEHGRVHDRYADAYEARVLAFFNRSLGPQAP